MGSVAIGGDGREGAEESGQWPVSGPSQVSSVPGTDRISGADDRGQHLGEQVGCSCGRRDRLGGVAVHDTGPPGKGWSWLICV